MLAICVEASHQRGLGHLFRACVLGRQLRERGNDVRFFVNDEASALAVLQRNGFDADIVSFADESFAWVAEAINHHNVRVWINDRHQTTAASAAPVKATGIPLVTFDDRGSGAALADLHVAALAFDPTETLKGQHVLRGLGYLILDPAIAPYRRLRSEACHWLVTLGGADTYGVTPKVVRALARKGLGATVVVGPAFKHDAELAAVATPAFTIKRNVPSMIEELARHDCAITGGGVTPFEANASGVPCLVIANEDFEVPVGRALEQFGSARFLGRHTDLDEAVFDTTLPVAAMSKAALANVKLDGVNNVVGAVTAL